VVKRRLKNSELTDYENQLKEILTKKSWPEWQKDPALLTRFPLASPYFLSHLLSENGDGEKDVKLGQALLQAIKTATKSLWVGEWPRDYDGMKAALDGVLSEKEADDYHAIHLELRFFKKFLRPSTVAAIHDDYLVIGRTEEFTLFNGTIRRVGQRLLAQLGQYTKPLPQLADGLIGIERHVAQLEEWLAAGEGVNLTGQGGIGKSTLALSMAHAWPNATFWYTIRPHLNDRLSSFLFELGHFLHRQGYSNLWQLVLSEGGNIQNGNLALGVLMEDLQACEGESFLFIIDELDRLYSPDIDLAKPHHVALLEFLEEIQALVPMLFVGQQAVLKCEHNLELVGLMPVQITQLLQLRTISPMPSKADIETLYQATKGNPRLLLLSIALYQSEHEQDGQVTFAQIVTTIAKQPGFGPILNRLWDRLDNRQRELLQRLAVYPESAPQRYWPAEYGDIFKETAQQLVALRLVEEYTTGSVAMLPALRERIYSERLTPDLRNSHHLDAAEVHAALGAYTEAAYHLHAGGEPDQAIQLWYPVMQSEVQRGKAGIAYDVFVGMERSGLSATESRALAEIQAHLHELSGEIEAALEAVGQIDLGEASEQRARLQAIEANFRDALGYPYSAQEGYQCSIDTLARLIGQTADAYYGSGMSYVRQRELSTVEDVALKIEQEHLMLRGFLAKEKGEFGRAYTILNEALAIAQKRDDLREVAKIYWKLSGTQMFREQFDDAIWYAEQAKEYYKKIGDRLESAKVDNALAAIYLECKNYEEAIRIGEQAVRFFKNSKSDYFAATTQTNVAEAYFYLGNHEKAAALADEIVENEEPHAAPYAYYTLGLIREAAGEFKYAALYFERALEMAEQTGSRFMEAFARRAYGKMLCLDNQPLEGREELSRALSQFKAMGKELEAQEAEMLLGECGAF